MTPGNRAVRLHGARDIRLADEARPAVADGELLLRITAVGLCGSDRHAYLEGGIGGVSAPAPLVPCHEVGGVVEGGALDGARVAIDPAIPCGRCATCARGARHLCPDVLFAGYDRQPGGLQQYLVWPADRVAPVPDSMPSEQVPLLEVLGIALHSIDLAHLRPAQRIGVFGSGPVGLVLTRALRAAGADVVIATDVLPHRVEAARASGAGDARLVDALDSSGSGLPEIDLAFECSGDQHALDSAIMALAPGGRVMLVGIPEGVLSQHYAVAARRKEVGLQWVRRMADGDLERGIELVRSGALGLDGIVSDRLDLEHAADAFAMLEARSGLKVVVEPNPR